MHIRVRFAPSPTGHLHIGGARTALFNYLFARQNRGTMILRIEDTDTVRNQAKAQETLLSGLRWLGIEWDEGPDAGGNYGPYISSQRSHIHQEQLQRLLRQKNAYPCFCSPKRLDDLREQAKQENKPFQYPGTCRLLTKQEIADRLASGEKPAYRFRVPHGETVEIVDSVRGTVSFSTDDLGDFLIYKANQQPLFNFAVTVDDILMKITHVIRGEEHLPNTPSQILLFHALGHTPPKFAHLPLILNMEGKKLSKRDASIDQFIDCYQERGYLPEAIINFISLLGWSPAPGIEEELFSLPELIKQFSLQRVHKAGAIFDPGKLQWMNGQYIRRLSRKQLTKLALPYLQKVGYIDGTKDRGKLSDIISLFQTSLQEIGEIATHTKFIFQPEQEIDPDAKTILTEPESQRVTEAFLEKIQFINPMFSVEDMRSLLKEVQKSTNLRGKKLFLPVRACCTGKTQGPDLPHLLHCLGREEILYRSRLYLKQVGIPHSL
ncbi:glutamate--tRNA ligase [Pasteuria penetrans]|uniref:glutamate--tRNA ligase n=1 Tax=Pasteuria penetrans TaxID=86005 RepID=UPI000F9BFFB8|nr:glutamate--tRNA ligase [Pasteuria penetrans]